MAERGVQDVERGGDGCANIETPATVIDEAEEEQQGRACWARGGSLLFRRSLVFRNGPKVEIPP